MGDPNMCSGNTQHKKQNMQEIQEKCRIYNDHMKRVILFSCFEFYTLIVLASHIVLSKLIAFQHQYMLLCIQRTLSDIYDGPFSQKLIPAKSRWHCSKNETFH